MLLPWTDRRGQFAPLRAGVFVLLFAPALWLLVEATQGWLGSRPSVEAIHQAGLWAIRILAVGFAVTPLRVASRNAKLAGVRRMLGLAVLGYAALHFSLYIYDQNFAAGRITWEILTRIYLLVGFVALLGLAVLGATSSDGMVRRLGAPRWAALHRAVYAVVALCVVHFFMQSKLDETQPLILGGIFAGLAFARLARLVRGDVSIFATVLIAVFPAALTALAEAGWYAVKTGAPFDMILAANLDFTYTIRPAWYVLAAGKVLLAARLSRPLFAGSQTRVRRTADLPSSYAAPSSR